MKFNTYVLNDLCEDEVNTLLQKKITQEIFTRESGIAINNIDTDGEFLDGTPKYFVTIKTEDNTVPMAMNKKRRKI